MFFTELDNSSGFELPKGFKLGKSLSQTPQVHLDNISVERGGQLALYWDVVKGRYPAEMMQEMFAGYQRVLNCLANDPKNGEKTDFDPLINAQPDKYQAVGTKQCYNSIPMETIL